MTDDEVKVFEKLGSTEERQQFLEQAGYWQMWKDVNDMKPHVMEGKVVKGMDQDEVYMCWDKPVKIRKDFKKDAYVDILYYTFEIDRKGNEFLWSRAPPPPTRTTSAPTTSTWTTAGSSLSSTPKSPRAYSTT